jgi:hypothetical protein
VFSGRTACLSARLPACLPACLPASKQAEMWEVHVVCGQLMIGNDDELAEHIELRPQGSRVYVTLMG